MTSSLAGRCLGLLLCVSAALLVGCGASQPDEAVTVESLAKRYGIVLPPVGTAPILAFQNRATETPEGTAIRGMWLEWPDGTEIIAGRSYTRTRIVAIEQGKLLRPDFRYRRFDGDEIYAINKQFREFGEYYVGPRRRRIGQRWTSEDAVERKECEVVRPQSFNLHGKSYSDCYDIRCKTTGTSSHAAAYQGEDLLTTCVGIGTVHLTSIISSGGGFLRIENRLVDLVDDGQTKDG